MHFHNFYIKMYMHVFCMALVLHHASFLTTRLASKLRGLTLNSLGIYHSYVCHCGGKEVYTVHVCIVTHLTLRDYVQKAIKLPSKLL